MKANESRWNRRFRGQRPLDCSDLSELCGGSGLVRAGSVPVAGAHPPRPKIHLAHALRDLSPKAYEVISQRVDEVGRMIGGWLKQSGAAKPSTP